VRCKRPPVTKVAQIANRQNGEFEAAHSRTANLKRHIAASRKKGYRKFNRLQYPFIISEYEPTLKGCAVGARR